MRQSRPRHLQAKVMERVWNLNTAQKNLLVDEERHIGKVVKTGATVYGSFFGRLKHSTNREE